MKRSHLVLLALAAASSGCNTGFDPQYRVTDVRILGVRAAVLPETEPSRADVVLGESIRLSTLVANPRHRGPVTVSFYGCIPTGLDAFTSCVDPEVLKDPTRLAALSARPDQTGVLLLGQVVLPPPAGTPPPKFVEGAVDVRVPSVPGALDPLLQRASEQPTYQCSLFAELPVVVVAEVTGLTAEVALKRVRVVPGAADFARFPTLPRSTYTVNDNPIVVNITRAEVGSTCQQALPISADRPFPMGSSMLCGVPDKGQLFNVCDANGVSAQDSESRSWQWFVDAGEFPDFTGIGNAVDSSPEFQRPPGAFTLWVVLRDGRGGVAWDHRDVAAAP